MKTLASYHSQSVRCDYCSAPAVARILANILAGDDQQPHACKRCLPRAAATISAPFLRMADATVLVIA